MKIMNEVSRPSQVLHKNEEIDTGTSDVPIIHTFQSSERHSDVTPQTLSEKWGIIIAQATKTLQKTTQRFLRSAILPSTVKKV